MQNIKRKLKEVSGMSNNAIEVLTANFTKILLPKKHIIITEGTIDRNFYFIEEGISRCFYRIDGKEITTWFSREGESVFSILSCYYNKPCHDYVQLLEKSVVYSIPMDTLDHLYATNIEIANWGRIFHQNAYVTMEMQHIERLGKSARDRYLTLMDEQPDLFQRVNLGHIASYLGISQVTLCALRKSSV